MLLARGTLLVYSKRRPQERQDRIYFLLGFFLYSFEYDFLNLTYGKRSTCVSLGQRLISAIIVNSNTPNNIR